MRSGQAQHFVGHNPVGAIAVIVLMVLVGLSVYTGWLLTADDAAEWLEEAHEIAATTLITLVLVHVVGVLWSSRTHGENLLKAMLTGRKTAPSQAGRHSPQLGCAGRCHGVGDSVVCVLAIARLAI